MPDADVLLFNISSFIAGLFVLEYGADKFIDHTAIVAKRLNVSPTLIGLLTCGAEWEELVVVAVALGQKSPRLALGNVIGSSVANVLSSFSLGLLFIRGVEFDRSSKIYTIVLVAATSLFLLLLATVKAVSRWIAGSLSISLFVVYVGSVAALIYRGTLTAPEDDTDSDSDSENGSSTRRSSSSSSRTHSETPTSPADGQEQNHRLTLLNPSNPNPHRPRHRPRTRRRPPPRPKPTKKPLHNHILHLLLGLAALLLSSYILAHSASTIGQELSLSSTVVGTTILSLATTLPEKVIAVMGGVRHQPGILVANTVGSNIFLVTLCAGVVFLGGDTEEVAGGFTVFELAVVWLSAMGILSVVLVGGRRWMGVVMVVCYLGFLVGEFVMGRKVDGD